jgi:hypothetical protein
MELKSTKKEIVEQLSENQNVCLPLDVRRKIDESTISTRDLEDAGIPAEIIPHIFSYDEPNLESKQHTNPTQIREQGILEVYFWGLRTSGKTCALAGILKTIQNDGHFQSASNCYNEEYLQSLKDRIVHNDNLAYLPNRSPAGDISYMNFNLIREYSTTTKNWLRQEKIKQGITTKKVAFIDLSGELILDIVENKEKGNKTHEESINTLKILLNNSYNRKIHFFFVDYDNENKNLNQVSKLEQLIAIFKQQKYFDKTDFIYIVITKSDTFKDKDGNPIHKNKRREFAKNFFQNQCKTLRTNILEICKTGKGVNMNRQGQVDLDNYILDFSMGDVYFKRLCKFDASSAKEIESILFSKVNSTDELYG